MKEAKKMLYLFLIIMGAVMSAIGGYFLSEQSVKELKKEVSEKNAKIEKLNNFILSSITGGDSFCYLALTNINTTENDIVQVAIVHQGKYPLYDVSARIVDVDKFNMIVEKKNKLSYSEYTKYDINKNLGNLAPNFCITDTIKIDDLNKKTSIRMNIFYSARNGSITQLIRCKKIGKSWFTATKVVRGSNVIYEKIDNDYPKSNDGVLEWEK